MELALERLLKKGSSFIPALQPPTLLKRTVSDSFVMATQASSAATPKHVIIDVDDLIGDRLARVTGKQGDKEPPRVVFSDEARAAFTAPYRHSFIVKLLGKHLSYTSMIHKLKSMWRLKNSYKIVDLGYDYYLVKCDLLEDRDNILLRGPWMILGFYLGIKPWTIDFRVCEESFGSTLVWFRIRGMNPMYYHEKAFKLIASAIGVPFKVDLTTGWGRFARACVQIDLGVPIKKKIRVDDFIFEVEYETVDLICNKCSCFGHKADECVSSKKERLNHNDAKEEQQPVKNCLTHSLSMNVLKRPEEGFVKVNYDDSVFPHLDFAGFGCVIRDSSGTWLKGTSGRVRGINVLRTELFGIWRGLVKAWEAGFRLVECETDCVEAFNLVQLCHLVSMHNERWILEKILEFKQRNWTIKFSWVQRNANRVADYLAKQGAKTHHDYVDWSVPNEHLLHLLQCDLLQ